MRFRLGCKIHSGLCVARDISPTLFLLLYHSITLVHVGLRLVIGILRILERQFFYGVDANFDVYNGPCSSKMQSGELLFVITNSGATMQWLPSNMKTVATVFEKVVLRRVEVVGKDEFLPSSLLLSLEFLPNQAFDNRPTTRRITKAVCGVNSKVAEFREKCDSVFIGLSHRLNIFKCVFQ